MLSNINLSTNPLVTVLLVTYNQEQVVEEAVKSIFLQNYSPLQIILSDDCSTDNTFEVLQKMANNYHGPHELMVNRNPVNMGIGKHWDSISRRAKGRLIVHAAGDDISVPSRVEVVVKAWSSVEPRPSLISSDGMIMTYDGHPVKRHIGSKLPEKVHTQREPRAYNLDFIDVPVCGFSLAIDRSLYEIFEPIQDRLWAEDELFRRRAIILQGIMYIPDVLVFYRDQGLSKGATKSQKAYLNRYHDQATSRLSMILQTMRDINMVSIPDINIYRKILLRQERSVKRRLKMMGSKFFVSLVILIRQIIGTEEYGIDRNQYFNFFLVRWFPKLFFGLRNLKNKLQLKLN